MTKTINYHLPTTIKIANGSRKYNATRHKILTKLILSEETSDAKSILKMFELELAPEGMMEHLLVNMILVAYMRLQRAVGAESDYMREIYNPPEGSDPNRYRIKNPEMIKIVRDLGLNRETEGFRAKITDTQIDKVQKTFARYIVTCERQFYRSLHELQRMQSVRRGLSPTSMAIDVMREDFLSA